VAKREIVLYPDPVLRKVCEPVKNINGNTISLVDDLVETMCAAPHGVGISAPQIGESQRVIVVDVSRNRRYKRKNHGLIELINPVIVHSEGEKITREGCMSLPEYVAFVKRARIVVVRGWDRNEREIEIEAKNLEAVALQHEIDHLDGILFIDRIASASELICRDELLKGGNNEKE